MASATSFADLFKMVQGAVVALESTKSRPWTLL
jgi:hypothetical protein